MVSKSKCFIEILGGWNAGSKKFSEMAADPAKRQIFLDSIVPFVKEYGFEGVDLDWEYPGSRDTIDEAGDKENFSVLCKMMSELLHEHGLLFTAALSPGIFELDAIAIIIKDEVI